MNPRGSNTISFFHGLCKASLHYTARLYLLLPLLISVAISPPTASTAVAQEDTIGYPGEIYYKPLTNLVKSSPFPNAVSSGGQTNIGFLYGSIAQQYARDNVLETCFFHRTADFVNNVGTCVFRLNPTGGSYLMKRFTVKYSGTTNTDKPVFAWDTASDKTLNLLIGKHFIFLPTDQTNAWGAPANYPNFFLAVCTEKVGADTRLYLAEIAIADYTVKYDRYSGTSVFYTYTGGTFVVTKRSRVSTYHETKYNVIWNPLDTSKPYRVASQPSNNIVFAYRRVVTENIYCWFFSPLNCPNDPSYTFNFIFDIAVEGNSLYLLTLGTDSARSDKVMICSLGLAPVSGTSVNGALYIETDNGGGINVYQVSSYSTTNPRVYWNFALFTGSQTSKLPIRAIMTHNFDTNNDNNGQVISLNKFITTTVRLNTNVVWPIRPSENTQIEIVNTGVFNSIMNIKHYVNNKLTYLDIWNFYNVADQDNLANQKFWRIPVTECDDAFAGASDLNSIATMTLNNFIMVHCVKDNILTSSIYGAEPAYTALLKFDGVTTATNINVESQSTMTVDANPVSFFKQTLSYVPWTSYFTNMPTYVLNPNTLTVTENSYKSLPFTLNTMIGATMRVTMDNPLIPGLYVLDNKQHVIQYKRSDLGSTDSDQVVLNSIGGVYEDDNRKVGVMTCTEFGNYQAGYFERLCVEVANFAPNPVASIIETIDLTKANCQSILIRLKDKVGTKQTFLVYDTIAKALLKYTDMDGYANYGMGCANSDTVIAIGWNNLDATNPPKVIAFSLSTKANVPAPTGFANFGLESCLNIVSAGLTWPVKAVVKSAVTGLVFNYATYMPNTKILAVATLPFNKTSTKFEGSGLFDYIYTENWYNSNTKICFLKESFIIFDPTSLSTPVKVFYGEYYMNNKKRYAQSLIDISQVGNFDLKSVFCHRLQLIDSISIYGEKTFTGTDGFTYTHSVVATFEVSDAVEAQRLYNLQIFQKKFISVTASDNGNKAIYFRLKEFMSSNIFYRVQWEKDQSLAYFNLVQGDYDAKFIVSNSQKNQSVTLKLTVNKQQSIVVTPNSGLEYIAGQELSLLNSATNIASLVSGPIFSIELIPSPTTAASNLVQKSRRINLLSDAAPALRPTTTPSVLASSIKVDRFPNGTVIYSSEDKSFYIYKNGAALARCQVTNSDVSTFKVALADRALINRLYIVFSVFDKLYMTFYDFTTSTCSSIDVVLMYTALGTGTASEIFVSSPSLFLISPIDTTGTTASNDFMLTIFKAKGVIEYYYSTKIAAGVTPLNLIYVDAENIPAQVNSRVPYTAVDGYIDCKLVYSPSYSASDYILATCLTKSDPSSSVDQLLIVNLNHKSATPSTRTYPYTDSTLFASAMSISCYFKSVAVLNCAVDISDGSFITFDLPQITDPDPLMFAFEQTSLKYINSAVPVDTLSIAHNDKYSVVFGRKKQGSYILGDAVAIVYKDISGTRLQYAGVDIGVFPVAGQVGFGYFCDAQSSFFAYDGVNSKLKVYNISEVAIAFPPALLADLNGVLRFSNPMIGSQIVDITLKSLFRPQVFYVPPPPPEPTPLWKIYWWVPLVVIALVIAVLFLRVQWLKLQERNRLARMKNEQVITNLKEFYY